MSASGLGGGQPSVPVAHPRGDTRNIDLNRPRSAAVWLHRQGHFRTDTGSAAPRAVNDERSIQRSHAVLKSGKAAAGRRRRTSDAVILDLER
jgi:hypothetical protein